jgi:BlaI family penicillinase repressor
MAPKDELPSLANLSPVQRAALQTLWEIGEGTVYDLLDRFPEPKPPYTSVLSALQKLRKLGWVSFVSMAGEKGRYYLYRAAHSRAETEGGNVRRILTAAFGGDAYRMAQQLITHEELSADELADLRRLIDERRRQVEEPPDV